MKKFTLLVISLWAILFVVQPVYAGFISAPKQVEGGNPIQKSHPKLDKMADKFEKSVQKMSESKGFLGKILKKHGEVRNKWFIPMLVFLIIAIVLALVPIHGFGWLSYIAYVVFVVLFILWLLTFLDVM